MSMIKTYIQSIVWALFSYKGRMASMPFAIVFGMVLLPYKLFWTDTLEIVHSVPHGQLAQLAVSAWGFAMVWIGTALLTKRLHDVDQRGWWIVALFALSRASVILLYAALILLALWRGTKGKNRFGVPPVDFKDILPAAKMTALGREFSAGKMDATEFNAKLRDILPKDKKTPTPQ